MSGYLEKCCLLLSANESYERSQQDIEVLTGMRVSHSTHQRLVHRHDFPGLVVPKSVEAMSIDGGKVRSRTPLGEECVWNDYKAIRLHEQTTKVPGSLKRIERAQKLLWQGKLEDAMEEFKGCKSSQALNFVAYLQRHRTRIPNYEGSIPVLR
jgi:hypothetical protein